MGFFTKKQVKLSAVAFNLNDFEKLNYNQLVEVNGGCGGGVILSKNNQEKIKSLHPEIRNATFKIIK